MTRFLTGILALCLALQAGFASAESVDSKSNARMLALQTRVDRLYESGNFERAFLIYRDELAVAGDKYAQYMVGYMILSGRGTTQNSVEASAWYRLAAEHGTSEFIEVRDALLADLDATERQQSDEAYVRLRGQYSDAAILLRMIKSDLQDLGKVTGTKIKGGSSPMTVVDPDTGRFVSGTEYYRNVNKRIERRLRILAKLADIEDIDTNADNIDLGKLEDQVRDYLSKMPD